MLSFIAKKIDSRVDERLNELIKSEDFLSFRKLTDKQAKKEISDFILAQKSEGTTQLTIFDIVLKLKLPAQQVEKIMDGFEREKKVKEVIYA